MVPSPECSRYDAQQGAPAGKSTLSIWLRKTNLEDLVEVGERLLKKPVSRVNLESGLCEPWIDETNEEALARFAKILSQEKQLRHARSPHGKKKRKKPCKF
ncbi:XYLOSE ISOMERASE [Salix koriyanagi]|uniref:XYLOSE ISOMERASE n=1 Tax=Salix koriyanagi TaxID=2511006 RepID=A0A9Q0TDU8_9ROSI|nr:XYLOSE ISOMERASE [Salix koriyanagi]